MSFKGSLGTLFDQGYRFSSQRYRADMKENLDICVDSFPKSTDAHPELDVLQNEFAQIVSNHSESVKKDNDQKNRKHTITGSFSFIEEINKELKSITEEYEQQTGIKGCTIS